MDLDQHPRVLAGARAVSSLGHDECYSAVMPSALARARNAGTNLAFLGANVMYGTGVYRGTTENLLGVFASGPAGRAHPAISTLGHVTPVRGSAFEGF